MTVQFFSPLPPARTGVADYSAALLKAMQQLGTVNLGAGPGVPLYHLGNNQLHRAIYERALEQPGVVALHDAVLQHFFLGSLGERAYIDEFVYNYGAWHEGLARQLWRERARSAADSRYFEYPMLRRIAERSRAIVVHNPAAAAMVRRHAPSAPIYEIPHLFEAPPVPAPPFEVERLRASLGVGAETLLVGVFGHLRESKRLLPILRALRRARQEAPLELLVAGEFASSDLERAAGPELHAEGVIRVGYLPDAQFWRYASAVDAGINLRYPAAGESSGIAVRLMGIGKPVLVTAGLENARLPEAACLRVEPGAAEEDMLVHLLLWLARHRADARAVGERAAAEIRRTHSPGRAARLYWECVHACYHKDYS